jgi:hypothetical protein
MPSTPRQFVLKLPANAGQLIPEPRFVGSILDRPEAEIRNARKFATVADAITYADGRPALRGSTVQAINEEGLAR